ncbi:DUF4245 domain-containing protein [Microlunatus sp. Y2014]|uniref:DUF4245 domain-containing protein n=1 Tax=Microlunatus sp. Y2014 TaxID=3418488 RepID=UPI003DA72CC9
MARAARNRSTVGDMVRSLAVLLIPVLAITLLFTIDPKESPGAQPIDWEPARDQAAAEAGFEVVAPARLPDSWTPVRVAWENEDEQAQRWMLGWLDPQQTYFAVEQGNSPPMIFIARVSRDGVADGVSQVGDQTWHRYRSPDDRTRSLVITGPDVTTVVVADASYEALEAFAATLEAS